MINYTEGKCICTYLIYVVQWNSVIHVWERTTKTAKTARSAETGYLYRQTVVDGCLHVQSTYVSAHSVVRLQAAIRL